MERKIGEIFELQGKWYKTIEDKRNVCDECAFCDAEGSICDTYRDIIGHCSIGNRHDNISVTFVEIHKPTGIITSNPSDKKKLLLIYLK